MNSLAKQLQRIRQAAGLRRASGYQHFEISHSPSFMRRIAFELEYAYRLSLIHNGEYDAMISHACDMLEQCLDNEGALTRSACLKAEELLMSLSDEAKGYTIHLVSHAHIDMNWQWPYHETVSVTLETFRTMLQLMKEYPEFTYAQSQASTYRIVELHEPEMLEEIKQRIHEGRWEVSASTWVEADKNMPNEESMVRHLLYTKQYLSQLLDIPADSLNLDYEPDTFGHSANVPEILSQGGVKYYYHCRGFHGHPIYRWRGQSGAEVLAFCEPTWYLGDTSPNFALYAPEFCHANGIRDTIKVYGVGDHGGGPTRRDLNLIEEMRSWPIYPTLKYSSYKAFYEKLEEKRESFPIVQRELNCVFTGCYTTQCRVKAANRVGEAALAEAETLCAGAGLVAGRKAADAFSDAWKNVLFSQFHDILTGSGVRDTREYAMATFSQSLAQANTRRASAMRAIAERIDTSAIVESGDTLESTSEGAGVGYGAMSYGMGLADRCASLTRIFHIFNPFDHARLETVELAVWDYPGELRASRAIAVETGKELEFQVLSSQKEGYMGHNLDRVLVTADVPAFGWCTVAFQPFEGLDPLEYPSDPRVHMPDEFHLENDYIRAEFESMSGSLVSFFDKLTGVEVLNGPAGFYLIEEDTDKGMSSWIVGRHKKRELLSGMRMRYGARGSMRNSVILEAEFGENHSTLKCEVCLDKNSRHLDLYTTCDWKEVGTPQTCIPQLAFSIPYELPSRILFDIPAGVLYRTPQDLDVPACHFAAAFPGQGMGMMLSTDSKYGFRSMYDSLQVTLIRASYDPDPYPERGLHQFKISVSLLPDDNPADLVRVAIDAARPMEYITARPHKGDLPMRGGFLGFQGQSVRLTVVKKAEDGNGWILRGVNYANAASSACVTLPTPPKAAYLCDALETPISELEVDGCAVRFTARPNGLITLRVE